MPSPGDLVFLAYLYTEDDRKRIADELFREGRRTYEETIREQLRNAGCLDNMVNLTDPGELTWLKEQADIWSSSIAETYNRDLLKLTRQLEQEWIEERGSLRGLNRWVFASRIRKALAKRDEWKIPQIAVTEHTRVYDHAVMRWTELNSQSGAGRAMVVPLTAVCPICQAYVNMGWVSLDEAKRVFSLPAHPNCPHVIKVEISDLPPCSELWRGGNIAWLKEKKNV